MRVFTDRVVSPGYTPDIAAATRHLLDAGAARGAVSLRQQWLGHLGAGGARGGARCSASSPMLHPMTMDQVQMKASRPRFCALSHREAGGGRLPDADVAGCGAPRLARHRADVGSQHRM